MQNVAKWPLATAQRVVNTVAIGGRADIGPQSYAIAAAGHVINTVTKPLTFVPGTVTCGESISLGKDAVGRGYSPAAERGRCPRTRPYTPFPGGLGISLPAL